MLVRARFSSPAPLILPFALALTTVPLILAPAGMAVFPPTLSGCSSLARKVCPVWLVLDPKACSTLTIRAPPAAQKLGGGGGGGEGAGGGGGDDWAGCSG